MNMKSGRFHRLIPLLASILMLVPWTGCVEPISPEGPDASGSFRLSLQVALPDAGLLTKSDPVSSTDAEKALHDLRVWAFIHGETPGDEAVAFANPTVSTTGSTSVTLSLKKDAVSLLDNPNVASVAVDIYVLGNAASAGFDTSLGLNATRTQVRDAVLSGTEATGFGAACVSTVPGTGLPMAAYIENVDVTSLRTGTNLDPISVELKRAVSKVRFVFAKGEGSEKVEISRIEFIGGTTAGGESIGLIPEQSYLFPLTEVKPLEAGYESIFWPKSETEALVADVPSVNALPQTYDASLDANAVVKTIYLRESDLPLKGRIRYERGSTQLMASFDLVALAETFPRNATFTVYAYYTGGEMAIQLTVEVDPWDKNNYSVNFEDASIFAEKKFSVDHSTAQEVVPIRVDPNDPSSKIVRYDVYLKPNSPVKGSLTILTPKMGTLIIIKKEDPIGSFVVSPQTAQINVNDGGTIEISIDRSNTGESGASMFLSFGVEWPGREANADTELIDNVYRFVL